MTLKKGDYVEIKITILNPIERAENLPQDTKNLPYEGKIRGYLTCDGEIGKRLKLKLL